VDLDLEAQIIEHCFQICCIFVTAESRVFLLKFYMIENDSEASVGAIAVVYFVMRGFGWMKLARTTQWEEFGLGFG
jgi:hypothetical protein